MDKFLRNYSLSIQSNSPDGEFIPVLPPFTLEFDINRNIWGSANPFTLRIYNLAQDTRNKILKDFWTFDLNRRVELKAGYGDDKNLPTILIGYIGQAFSVREGNNFITEIHGLDGGNAFTNAVIDTQFPEGTPQKTIIENMVSSLQPFGVDPGAIGDYPGQISRGNSYSGSTTDKLSELTGGGFFIDNAKANCLGDNECLTPGGIAVITSASGLLGTPVRQQTTLSLDMLFEPSIVPGQAVRIDSSTGANYNGLAKVQSVHHRGMISRAVCGNATTTIEVAYGSQGLIKVPTVTR